MSDTTAAVTSATNAAMGTPSSPALGLPTSASLSSFSSSAFSASTTASSSSSGSLPLFQAIHSINIKSLVPYTLDMQVHNFSKWCTLFLLILGRFNLRDHVDSNADPNYDDPEWVKEDLTIINWIFNTISEDLLDMMLKLKDSTAYKVWIKLASYFTGNKASRAVTLEAELHDLSQGEMPTTAYCHRLQQLANTLEDCDQPVSESTLIHQMIRGLNPKYTVLRTLPPLLPDFPTFMEAHDLLIRDENSRPDSGAKTTDSALVAAGTTPNASDSAQRAMIHKIEPSPPPPNTNSLDRGRGRGARHGLTPPAPASLGAVHQALHLAKAYQVMAQPTTTSAPTVAPSFDTANLMHPLHASSLQQQYPNPEWFMDTGA